MPVTNNDTPWVSFCMSTYRRPGILQRSLEILRTQTFPNFEVVISDNDPEGSARSVVESMGDSRFRYYHNGDNLGMINSFNKSIERSRGEFTVVITDDDPVYPNMLQVLHDLYVKYPGYGIYFGGHDTVYTGTLQAAMVKARVGTNSALAAWNLDAEKTFSPEEFLQVFLDGTLGGSLLWSVGIVKREIALAIGGIPAYGTPHLADCSYILLSGARSGCVYINTALGYRSIHDGNYTYAEANFESLYRAPEGFYKWTLEHLPASLNTPQLQQLLTHYIGRDMTVVVIAIQRMLRMKGVRSEKFEDFQRRFFRISFLRKWRRKYTIATRFPNTFELLIAGRKMFLPSSINLSGR